MLEGAPLGIFVHTFHYTANQPESIGCDTVVNLPITGFDQFVHMLCLFWLLQSWIWVSSLLMELLILKIFFMLVFWAWQSCVWILSLGPWTVNNS